MKTISLRLNEKEYKDLQNKIEKAGMNQSEYLREVIANSYVYPANTITDMTIQLSGVGNNLNQLTRGINYLRAHYDIAVMSIDIDDLLENITSTNKEVLDLCQLLKSYLPKRRKNAK